jgi:hypothetical protein
MGLEAGKEAGMQAGVEAGHEPDPQPRHDEDRGQRRAKDQQVKEGVAQVGRDKSPGVRAEQAGFRRQEVAVLAKKPDLARFGFAVGPSPRCAISSSTPSTPFGWTAIHRLSQLPMKPPPETVER